MIQKIYLEKQLKRIIPCYFHTQNKNSKTGVTSYYV